MSDREKVAAGANPMELRVTTQKLQALAGNATRLATLARDTAIARDRLERAAKGEIQLTTRELEAINGHPLL